MMTLCEHFIWPSSWFMTLIMTYVSRLPIPVYGDHHHHPFDHIITLIFACYQYVHVWNLSSLSYRLRIPSILNNIFEKAILCYTSIASIKDLEGMLQDKGATCEQNSATANKQFAAQSLCLWNLWGCHLWKIRLISLITQEQSFLCFWGPFFMCEAQTGANGP